MNIYEKLQTMRVELQKLDIKKSGKNSFSKYGYYELSDFLPGINKLMQEHKTTSIVTFDADMATLTLINTEKPDEKIVFTSPMSTASLKGCHDIQNLGAVETYERRYLYMNAFEIVEADALDGENDQGNKTPTPHNSPQKEEESQKPLKLLCPVCKKEIKDVKKEGVMYSAKEVFEKCNGMCMKCYKENKDA